MTPEKTKALKIVLWDIETSGIITTSWNLYPEYISHENMLQDWFIISTAWKELGSDKVHTVSLLDDPKRFKKDNTDDYHVIKTVRDMLEDVDILVHHNGDKFDLKAFTWRLIYHGLPPLPKMVTVDTLKEIKKISRATSNRLDFLATTLVGAGKQEPPKGTWLRALKGDRSAIKDMVKYNKIDVDILEGLYTYLRPYMATHPHVGVLLGNDKALSCTKCGSTKLKRNGVRVSAAGVKKQECQCQKCGSYQRIPFK